MNRRRPLADPFPTLYPILDAGFLFPSGSPPPAERWERLRRLARELAASGVTLLQYRNKFDDDRTVTEDALALREAAPDLVLILNDRAALVAPTGWDGVHVGQEDLSPAAARELVGAHAIVGLSTHTPDQVALADTQPVDYIAVGPIFPTSSKADASPVIGLEGIQRARSLTGKPLVAIGGITRDNCASVYDAGADSISLISAIFGSPRPAAECAKDFLGIFK